MKKPNRTTPETATAEPQNSAVLESNNVFRPEIFKEIPGMPGYFASNDGRIRKGNSKIMSLHETKSGYIHVQIMQEGKRFGCGVHRLVAKAFLGEIEGMEVAHINFEKKDNRVENLEIVTRAENMRRYHTSGIRHAVYDKISASQHERWSKIERVPKVKEEKPDGRGKHGKQGRKKSPEELVYMTRQIFKRQMPITAKEVREAIDYYRKNKNQK